MRTFNFVCMFIMGLFVLPLFGAMPVSATTHDSMISAPTLESMGFSTELAVFETNILQAKNLDTTLYIDSLCSDPSDYPGDNRQTKEGSDTLKYPTCNPTGI